MQCKDCKFYTDEKHPKFTDFRLCSYEASEFSYDPQNPLIDYFYVPTSLACDHFVPLVNREEVINGKNN